ncbi:MAG: tRNA pseudouridine(38-40) synthase TruA [Chitinivibrionia bacterium]|nr:tRNA pseudouridine(38-40) synthase TruA [Chitinivibrionia bacterium]
MRIFARAEYDGTNFAGWQIQPHAISVQEELQRAISQIVGQKVEIVGAGRTDAGVHAKNQGFHFNIDDNTVGAGSARPSVRPDIYAAFTHLGGQTPPLQITNFDKFAYKINSVLPPTIAVFDMQKVADDFHARFSATERIYHYHISLKKNPLSFNNSVFFGYKMDLQKMESELKSIIGTHSFESFCSSNNQLDHFRCTVNSAEIVKIDEYSFYIKIAANRFLYNMVRSIVGTLVDISRGKLNITMSEILAQKNRKFAGTTAPAKGLVLEDVRYDAAVDNKLPQNTQKAK